MQFKLTGWSAIPLIVLILGFAVFRFSTQSAALESKGVEEVKMWLLSESVRNTLPDMKRAMQDPQANQHYLAETAKKLQTDNFEILSATRHGPGSEVIVRVEIRNISAPSAETASIRYLKMHHSMASGWTVVRETTKWNYYLAGL